MTIFSSKPVKYAVILAIVSAAAIQSLNCKPPTQPPDKRFKYVVIDMNGPPGSWGKSVGDLNGDGRPDLIVGGHMREKLSLYQRVLRKLHLWTPGEVTRNKLVWYENPGWQKHIIADNDIPRTDHEVVDVDRDGRNDVVSITNTALVWFRSPDWSRTDIDTRVLHDIEVADFDGDGDTDIVVRNQSLFRHNNGNQLHFYRQNTPSDWTHIAISVPHGEGLKVADMDGDARPDVVVNDFWFQNPGVLDVTSPWARRSNKSSWDWPDVFIDVADVNADGKIDIVLAPSEIKGKRYRISWLEAPAGPGANWQEHIIDPDVEAVHHFIAVRDLDNDEAVDVVTAEMYQSDDPDEVAIYWNKGAGQHWEKEIVAKTGSHSMRVVDIDNDGDIDFFGANWAGKRQAVDLWENQTCPKTWDRWHRHVIDADKPWRSVFIMTADLDQDGYPDVVTGGWWYLIAAMGIRTATGWSI